MQASRSESVDSINFLGDVFLRVHALSCELPAPSFIGSAVALVSQSISCRSAWWGLVGRGCDEVTPTIYKKELIALPADFEARWLPISAQDTFAKEVESRIGEVCAFSTDENYGAPGKTKEVQDYCRDFDLAHGVSILLSEPFTRNHFFCTLYRGQGARPFDDIEMAYFGQLMRYTLEIWRENLHRMLSVPAAESVHLSGIADRDGEIGHDRRSPSRRATRRGRIRRFQTGRRDVNAGGCRDQDGWTPSPRPSVASGTSTLPSWILLFTPRCA